MTRPRLLSCRQSVEASCSGAPSFRKIQVGAEQIQQLKAAVAGFQATGTILDH